MRAMTMKPGVKAIDNKFSNFGKKKILQRTIEFDNKIIEIGKITEKSHRFSFIDEKRKVMNKVQ